MRITVLCHLPPASGQKLVAAALPFGTHAASLHSRIPTNLVHPRMHPARTPTAYLCTLTQSGCCACRFPGAVTAFKPGSHANMPTCATSVPGVFCAADWVAQGPGDAAGGAKGLSQEKALAAGLEAGNAVRARPHL